MSRSSLRGFAHSGLLATIDPCFPAAPAPVTGGSGNEFLRAEGILKRYGAATVLDRVDLTVAEDEFVCLLGPSGCGKTTLLRILCGLERPEAGRVVCDGRDITHASPAERRFGIVFQSYALFPNLTALENVAYGLRNMGREAREARARAMLELVDLVGHAHKYPAQLSGGQQQRVALARALAPEPRLLLLDEPLSALDAQVRVTLRSEIRALAKRLSMPVVMVTHDQDEALSMADRVVLMNAGRIEQEGTPSALYLRPATSFAASFIGRVNLLEAVHEGGGRIRLGDAWLRLEAPPARTGVLKVAIRPSHVRLRLYDPAAERAAWMGDGEAADPFPLNLVPAWVERFTFSGASISVYLRAPVLGEAQSHLEAEVSTPPDGIIPWREGERLWAELPAEALREVAP
ncbi:MAG: ATP-binding cassette domain-containing protein [Casimicrobiaceae bacterium]|nr:ATP-binding cassette domain-containing protein [Casimicrobiaceae bacterium]MDW8312408.1 ATP-binding cassette domain-containing protein [Burkholderiales bacterium]